MKGWGGGDPKEKIGSANEKLKGARIQSHAGGPFQQRESLSAGSRRDVFWVSSQNEATLCLFGSL